MGIVSTIVCKTAGIAGMSAVVYDAFSVGRASSSRISQQVNADHFERIHTSRRTLSTESPVNNAIQGKIADMRENNPIIPIYGKIKGFCTGALTSLGDNLLTVSCAALALTTKGFFSKLGAIGLAACGLFTVMKEGFGLSKQTPMD